MKIPSMLQSESALVIIGIIGAVLLFKNGGKILNSVNPLNNDNVINQAATSAYQQVTGSTGTIGTDLYDSTHDAQGNNTLNPANNNNVVNQGAMSLYQSMTGSTGTIGTDLYNWIHGT